MLPQLEVRARRARQLPGNRTAAFTMGSRKMKKDMPKEMGGSGHRVAGVNACAWEAVDELLERRLYVAEDWAKWLRGLGARRVHSQLAGRGGRPGSVKPHCCRSSRTQQRKTRGPGPPPFLVGACDSLFTPPPLAPACTTCAPDAGRVAAAVDSGASRDVIFTVSDLDGRCTHPRRCTTHITRVGPAP